MSQLCHQLHHLVNQLPLHRFPFNPAQLPLNGIYVLFEQGEIGHGVNRIVRIGTHTGSDKLRSRLKQHFITENKDRSIFRKNIGRALLSRDRDPFLAQWELDLTSRSAKEEYGSRVDTIKLKDIERQVSKYMQSRFFFVAFSVADKAARLSLESKIISTVSLCQECRPSYKWLGLSSPKTAIRESGLWLVNELYKQPLTEFEYRELERQIFTRI